MTSFEGDWARGASCVGVAHAVRSWGWRPRPCSPSSGCSEFPTGFEDRVSKSVRGRIKEKGKEHNKEIGKWEEEEDRREAEQVYENTKTVQEKLTQSDREETEKEC
ncbi:hypothetical protein FH972_012704 [Carpinus fangiana]|uniref:Uncharacterized protein n=1 Tax=Carpinus fangiana TaxID=176857 RepID=A0A5N6R658_9ROSI|nr:hypothetical protein FH972_012704 [Carpinus fangiana]